jgi:hypothetical protein
MRQAIAVAEQLLAKRQPAAAAALIRVLQESLATLPDEELQSQLERLSRQTSERSSTAESAG